MLLASIYAWYTFFLGAPVLRKCSPDKAIAFTLIVVLCGIALGIVLLSAYGVMYLVLREDEYALLAGALISFVSIATTMYATRRVDWSGRAQAA